MEPVARPGGKHTEVEWKEVEMLIIRADCAIRMLRNIVGCVFGP
jgi:hypothetical protein